MSRRWYWLAEVDLTARRVRLDPDETQHLLKVIRHRTGDAIEAIDGRGGRFTVALLPQAAGKGGRDRGLEAEILTVHPPLPAPLPLVLGVPLIPWPRLEALVDGAVQLGVTRVCAFEAERARFQGPWSQRRSVRLERIARSATAQSLGSHVPEIQGPRPLGELLGDFSACELWVAHGPLPDGDVPANPLPPVADHAPQAGRALVVGPEGGLTDAELAACFAAGARALGLGPRRLRTEVAAIAGLASLQARDRGHDR